MPHLEKRNGMAPDRQLNLALDHDPEGELVTGNQGLGASTEEPNLMAQILDRENLKRALRQVRQNRGAPGRDGMTVDELPAYLKQHWLELRAQLEAGQYRPQPVASVWPQPCCSPCRTDCSARWGCLRWQHEINRIY